MTAKPLLIVATIHTHSIQKESKMLVLTRRKDESIIVADTIEVRVLDIQGNKVRLGIKAPRSVPVHRKEIYETIPHQKTK